MKNIFKLGIVLIGANSTFGMQPEDVGLLQNKLTLINRTSKDMTIALFKQATRGAAQDRSSTPMVNYIASQFRPNLVERVLRRGGMFVIQNMQPTETIKINQEDISLDFGQMNNRSCSIEIFDGWAWGISIKPMVCSRLNVLEFERILPPERIMAIKSALDIPEGTELNDYTILGLDKMPEYTARPGSYVSASRKQIAKAFAKASFKWHPDKWRSETTTVEDKSLADEIYVKMKDAYERLVPHVTAEEEKIERTFIPVSKE